MEFLGIIRISPSELPIVVAGPPHRLREGLQLHRVRGQEGSRGCHQGHGQHGAPKPTQKRDL